MKNYSQALFCPHFFLIVYFEAFFSFSMFLLDLKINLTVKLQNFPQNLDYWSVNT